jgi:hypothetical protein
MDINNYAEDTDTDTDDDDDGNNNNDHVNGDKDNTKKEEVHEYILHRTIHMLYKNSLTFHACPAGSFNLCLMNF